MKHSNISIFIPHIGCPNMCSFCNQRTISGTQKAPSGDEVKAICRKAFDEVSNKSNSEIAFFGGSFTAIPRDYMLELLESVQEFLGVDGFKGIRISTRPDCIDDEVLQLLKNYGVTAIELGAQSMINKVLEANDRGHTVEDVYRACQLIRHYGFELGLQMMVGLYQSTNKDEEKTVNRIMKIHPDTLRIYPVVVLEGTKLAELYKSGEYELKSFDDMVQSCAILLYKFENSGINVIKCGLHASDGVEGEMNAGYYHPAFRELCESEMYKSIMTEIIFDMMQEKDIEDSSELKSCVFVVKSSCISKACGHKKSNIIYFKEHFGIDIKVIGDENIQKYQCEIRG